MRKLILLFLLFILLFSFSCGSKKEETNREDSADEVVTTVPPDEVFSLFINSLGEGNNRAAWDCLSIDTKKRHYSSPDGTVDLSAAYNNFDNHISKMMGDEKKRIQITSAVMESIDVKDEEALITVIFTSFSEEENSLKATPAPETRSRQVRMILTGDGWKIHSPGPSVIDDVPKENSGAEPQVIGIGVIPEPEEDLHDKPEDEHDSLPGSYETP